MSYVDNSLTPSEHVTFRTRLHPIIFAAPVILGTFSAAFLFSADSNSASGAGFFLFLALVIGLFRYFDFVTSEFAVTNKRVIIKVGMLRRRTLELQLAKVETVAVDQGILGRLIGYGNIVVTGTGGTKEPFKGISAPLEFRRAVQTDPA